MSRNRRNKRNLKKITDVISLKTFLIILLILGIIITLCLGIMYYRNYQDRELLAKQKEEIDKQIEEIFTSTEHNIANSNAKARESIVRISAVGDILCGEEMLKDAYQEETKTYQFTPMFQNITDFLKNSDIVAGTMETNFVSEKYSGYGKRNSPKEFADAVKNSGVNLVTISHNHSLDYGVKGLQDTKKYLENQGFSVVGDELDGNIIIKEVKDTKIAFLSYTYGIEDQNTKTKEELQTVSIYSEEKAKADLEEAKEKADYIFVLMHWGEDYANDVSNEQKKMADFLVENGANVILGNHPATIQPMEVKQNAEGENVFIAYSLGNYISSISNDKSKIELVLNIELIKSGVDGKVSLSKVDYTPIYVLDNGENAMNRYQLIDMKGVAKAYAGGNHEIVTRQVYNKLVEGLKLLEKVVGKK